MKTPRNAPRALEAALVAAAFGFIASTIGAQFGLALLEEHSALAAAAAGLVSYGIA